MVELCNRDCDKCPMIKHPNSSMSNKILSELFERVGDPVKDIIQNHNCKIDVSHSEVEKNVRPCNSDCNHCQIILHPNSRMLTKIFNELYDLFEDHHRNPVYEIVQNNCCNLTVCYDCRIDDFCHMADCELIDDDNTVLKKKRKLKLKNL